MFPSKGETVNISAVRPPKHFGKKRRPINSTVFYFTLNHVRRQKLFPISQKKKTTPKIRNDQKI
jgi:hypothetical protein